MPATLTDLHRIYVLYGHRGPRPARAAAELAAALEVVGIRPADADATFWQQLNPAWLAGEPVDPFGPYDDARNAAYCDLTIARGLRAEAGGRGSDDE